MELDRETHSAVDITSAFAILTFPYPGTATREVIARVDLGSLSHPLVGTGGIYQLQFLINNVPVIPDAGVVAQAGQTKIILASRPIPINPSDVLVITVVGLVGDTSVDTVVSLRDATPATISDIAGPGYTAVDHNFGGADNLAYQTAGGVGIANAEIDCYSADDWNVGNQSPAFIIATSRTGNDRGRWLMPMMLLPGDYVLRYFKPLFFGPDIKNITV